ncbi:MAG: NADH dehydrogenase (quinone) subunit D [Candidatus Sumerlaeia bacterium]|nr:NADH dehydrogenase (quinone) subunit D [Candidatus Sumerlaeia bacterium]
MGPQHPSTHGVLRVVLDLDGERVVRLRPVIGYLHSGKEKIAETKTYHQFIPYTDRIDYLAPMAYNTGYVMTVEKLLGIEVTERCAWLRTILCEMARISSHIVFYATHALELGATSPFMYGFRDRELLYDLFEEIAGARFTVSYMRIGGVRRDATDDWLAGVRKFCDYFPRALDEYEALLTQNEIFLQRTWNIGRISGDEAIALGLSGPSLRASGVAWDIRKSHPYLWYDQIEWNMAVEDAGDCYARYLVRMREMRESLRIIRQCLDRVPKGPVNIDNPKVMLPRREELRHSMEALIHHFLLVSEGFWPPAGEVYHAIEAPKGELGFYLVSDGTPKAYRLKIRAPSFCNLQSLDRMCRGALLADVVAIIGSLDIVMGDVDR